MKISVIAWDASFREKFHTIDSFCTQNYPNTEFEFIWVDFYENTNTTLLQKIDTYSNAKLLNLNNSASTLWHLGKCINAGIKASTGEILVLPDGDIIVQNNHLQIIDDELKKHEDLVVYFRRWDELDATHSSKSYQEDYLEKHTQLLNATNYAGCFALHRSAMQIINGYEESDVFAGAGANGMETYLRLRNAGLAIKWHNKKIYHPWHPSSGISDKKTSELIELSKYYKWINAYSGIKQSWILKNRELDLSFQANNGTLEKYLEIIPSLEELRIKPNDKPKTFKSFLKKIIR
jgi:hypothetical protein